jgi:hypothetical protein
MRRDLVRIEEATHTVLNTENVVVHGVDVIITISGVIHNASRVKTREVEGTCGLKLASFQAEWVQEESLESRWLGGIGCVEVEWNVGEVWIRKLEVRHIGTINLKLELVVIVEDFKSCSLTSRKILDWVVEVEFLNLSQRGGGLLDLGNDHVLWSGGKVFTLLGIQVHVVRVDIPFVSSSRRTPCDAEFYIVVLKGNEWKGRLKVFTESEAEWVESGSVGTTEEITRNRLGRVGRREHWGDEGRVGRVLVINDLTTDEEFNLGNLGAPVSGAVSLSSGAIIGDEIHIAEEISLAFEADSGHTTIGHIPLDHLAFHSLGEVGVALIGRAEKADFGLTDEVRILSTDSNKLGDTTRHFIL